MGDISEYQYTKAIRFKLIPENDLANNLAKDLLKSDEDNPLSSLISLGFQFKDGLKNFIFQNNNNEEFKLDFSISVKKAFLKKYFNNEFYKQNKKHREFSLKHFPFLKEAFLDWVERLEKNLDILNNTLKEGDHEQTLRADIAFVLQDINSKKGLLLIDDFLKEANHKDNEKNLQNLREQSREILEDRLKKCLHKYLPAQSSGLCIAQASLNYYTVNKKSKSFYDDKIKKVEDSLGKRGIFFNENKKILTGDKLQINLGNKELSFWEKSAKEYSKNKFSLDESYGLLKDFKAKMKSAFQEAISKGVPDWKIKENFKLFSDDVCLKKYIGISREIGELNKRKNPANKDKIRSLSKQRGNFLFDNRKGKKFQEYIKLCQSYKRIAQARGRLIAQKKGVEKEKIDAERNRYWAIILRKGSDHFLLLVDVEKRKEIKDLLDKSIFYGQEGQYQVYSFCSLTMRAFHKLCFAEESTFVQEMPDDLKELQKKAKECRKYKNQSDEEFQRIKNKFKLEYLKNVLDSGYANEKLEILSFGLDSILRAKDLNEFEHKLEECCYEVKEGNLSNDHVEELLKEFPYFKITSYDLEERNKNVYQSPESKDRRHTKEIWKKFWSRSKSIRLNPEIQIIFREKDEKIEKYLREKGFDLSKIKNRFLKDQFTAKLSFSLNAGKKHPELAFADSKEIKEKIIQFNNKFNEQNLEEFWKYGIDRGNIELATLCIAKFNKNDTYQVNNKTLLKPTFPEREEDIGCYELKKKHYTSHEISPFDNRLNPKKKRVIANLSYFIDCKRVKDKEWFEEKTVTCLDLTTAKVIKDKIVTNGDVLTFLKLKKETAKRLLFKLVFERKTSSKSELVWGENPDALYLKMENGEYYQTQIKDNKDNKKMKKEDLPIYFYSSQFEGLEVKEGKFYTKESVLKNLSIYLQQLFKSRNSSSKSFESSNKHTSSINKLNHLRDAVVANMIGVLFHLQKFYRGFIILEDLSESMIGKHFEQHEFNIERKLETALFQKLETIGFVPPHLKDVINFRETNKEVKQFGAIFFVNETGTSQNCPFCENPWNWGHKGELKYKERRYICGKHDQSECFFDTKSVEEKYKFLREIDDPDKVAAYNVAKKVKTFDDLKKLNKKEEGDGQQKKTNHNNKKHNSNSKKNSSGDNRFRNGLDSIGL